MTDFLMHFLTDILELFRAVSLFSLSFYAFFSQMFERETRREKILEARNKEIRLKEKTKGILGLGGGGPKGAGGGALSGIALSALKVF